MKHILKGSLEYKMQSKRQKKKKSKESFNSMMNSTKQEESIAVSLFVGSQLRNSRACVWCWSASLKDAYNSWSKKVFKMRRVLDVENEIQIKSCCPTSFS